MILQPIGSVRSPVVDESDENWGGVVSEIHLTADLAPGLQGLDQFSHVIIIYLMHRSTFDPVDDLVRRPQGRADMPRLGIFAQRAKHRPNPIGVTTVEVIDVKGNVVRVRGLDAIDGTPVLDVKPYYPSFDRVDEPHVPVWVSQLMKGYF